VCDAWREQPGPNLEFSGAEPFGHPQLFDILRCSTDAGAQRIRIESDCAALAIPETAARTIESGVRHLQLVMRGSDEASHRALHGQESSLRATLNGASAFNEVAHELGTRVHLCARVPVCRHNLHDLPAIVVTAAKAGISFVRLVLEDETLSPWDAAQWIEAACDTGIVHAAWVEVEGVPYGAAEGWELHLACVYRQVEGQKADSCERCPLDSICGGVSRGADSRITSRMRPPAQAQQMAARIQRGSAGPRGAIGA
jgi:MoaA/NifB/PqqE/SkfB family radical SAM enzyme